MTWTGHLGELRVRLILSLAAVLMFSVVGWRYSSALLALLTSKVDTLVFVAPAEAFLSRVQLALAIGVALASPVVLWEAWRYVRPALYPHERKMALWAVPIAYIALCGGVAISFFFVFPIMLRVLFALSAGPFTPHITVSRFLSVLFNTVTTIGLAFEIPLAVTLLVLLNVVDMSWLRGKQAAVLFLSFVLGAMLSPPGLLAQVVLALPIFALFEVGLALGTVAKRFRQGRGEEQWNTQGT